MILLDTNVLSELMRPAPDAAVLSWIESVDDSSLATAAPGLAELLTGVALLPPGRRRDELTEALHGILAALVGRIWAFDDMAAAEYAVIVASRHATGAPISTMDAQIAAIARSRGAAVATRDLYGMACGGLVLVDPWSYAPAHPPTQSVGEVVSLPPTP